jgi:hypothetical protein
MSPLECRACATVNQTEDVRSPDQLRVLLAKVRDLLRAGSLAQVAATGSVVVQEIDPDGSWPDLLQGTFQCAECGMNYELSVETYHGSGGVWKPTPPACGSGGVPMR